MTLRDHIRQFIDSDVPELDESLAAKPAEGLMFTILVRDDNVMTITSLLSSEDLKLQAADFVRRITMPITYRMLSGLGPNV